MTDTTTAPTPTTTTDAVVSLPTEQSGPTLSLPTEDATTPPPPPTLSTAPSALDQVEGFYEHVFSTAPGETPAQKATIAAIIERSFAKGYTYNGQPFTPAALIAWREQLIKQYPQMEFRVTSATQADVGMAPPTVGAGVAIAWRIDAIDAASVRWCLDGMSMLLVEGGLAVTNLQYGDAEKGWRKA